MVVGIPFANPSDSGSVRAFSGADGSILFSLSGTLPDDHFGDSCARAGDANGDGVTDFIVAAPDADTRQGVDTGSAIVFSGSDGSLLFKFEGSSTENCLFGWSVDNAGNLTGNGQTRIIVGVPCDDIGAENTGSARVFTLSPMAATAALLVKLSELNISWGSEQSLSAPLKLAFRLLNDTKAGHDAVAMRAIETFLILVEIHFNRGDLSSAEADQLREAEMILRLFGHSTRRPNRPSSN